MTRKRLLFATLAVCLVAVCVAIFLLAGSSTKETTRVLPDGSVLILRKITKGTKHRYVSGTLLQRTATRVLPERWAKKVGGQAVTYNSSNVTHILWLERSQPTNSPRGTVFQTILGAQITNGAGFDRTYQVVAQLFTTNSQVQGFLFDAGPTDGREIRVTVPRQPLTRWTNVSFDMSNPDFVSRRKWQAKPCPLEAAQDDVSLRLERFTTQAQNPVTARHVPWTEMAFAIEDRTVRTNNWFARSVRIFNQAGSEFLPPVYPTDASGARTYATFPGGLSSAESYKLRFELRRTSYGPEEQHVFSAVPVPTPNGPPSQPVSAKLQGFKLVLALVPGGHMTARIEPPTGDWRLDPTRVVDDRGRWLPVRGSSSSDGRFSGTIALETNSATIDVTFGLTRLRTLELIARPSLGP